MSRRLIRSAFTAAALAATMFWFTPTVSTQVTALAHDTGATGLGLALRQLPNDGAVLYVTAHPDDENNGVLVALNRGRGLKTSLLTVTRGDGGQNEIGSELFQAIGILRSEELARSIGTMAPISTSPAPLNSATPSAWKRRLKSGARRKSSAMSSRSSAPCAPTSSSR